MKGIAHFAVGIAIATCFPEVVKEATGGALLPLLGGIAGILPDTLDFKVLRYWERYDLELDPGVEPDAGQIAAQLAGAMRRAYEIGQRQRVLLRTVRLGADAWRQIRVRFDASIGAVAVRVGPAVSTGQAVLPGWSAQAGGEAHVSVGVPLALDFDDEVQVDIFSGPSLTFERQGDVLHVRLLDWHRRWTHSVTFAAALGLGVTGVAALAELLMPASPARLPLWAGLIVALAVLAHVGADQLGYMGSRLFYPFDRGRTRGLRLFHSGDALPNFATIWAAGWLTLFNLDRLSAQPLLPPGPMVGLGLVVPLAILGALAWGDHRRKRAVAFEPPARPEVVAEAEEAELG